MKEYWLILESYVFIWSDSKEVLLYNSLLNKGFAYKVTPHLKSLIKDIENKENLYCISIRDSDLANPFINNFISSLRYNCCADLYAKDKFPNKPFVFIPELNINEEEFIGRKNVKKDLLWGMHAVNNLLEVVIYLTGNCDINCDDCNKTSKQILWCNKNKDVLSTKSLMLLLKQIINSSVQNIKIVGGDILSYPYLNEFISELQKYIITKNIYINYKHITDNNLDMLYTIEKNGFVINILIDQLNLIQNDKIFFILNEHSDFKFIFKITSINEYNDVSLLVDRYGLNARIIPFYTGNNLSFFSDFIFQDQEDILNTKWHKNDIFANMVVNANDFGRIIISSNGEIFTNLNLPAIGDVNDNLKRLINNELQSNNSWRRTRNEIEPCKFCLYKFLCPPISNYETAIGRYNLCNLLKD